MVTPNSGRKAPISILLATIMLLAPLGGLLMALPHATAIESGDISLDDPGTVYEEAIAVPFTFEATFSAVEDGAECEYDVIDDQGAEVLDDITVAPQGGSGDTCPTPDGQGTVNVEWTIPTGFGDATAHKIRVTLTTTSTLPGQGDEQTFTTDGTFDVQNLEPGIDETASQVSDATGAQVLFNPLDAVPLGPTGYIFDVSFTEAYPDTLELITCAGTVLETLTEEDLTPDASDLVTAQFGGDGSIDLEDLLPSPDTSQELNVGFEVVATDQAGQTDTFSACPASETTLQVDNQGPTVGSFTDISGTTLLNEDAQYADANLGPSGADGTFVVTEPNGIDTVTLEHSGPNQNTIGPEAATSSITFPASSLPTGEYTLKFRATDDFGNTGPFATAGTVTVDNEGPELREVTFQAVDSNGEARPECSLKSFGPDGDEPLGISSAAYCDGPYTVTVTVREEYPARTGGVIDEPLLTPTNLDDGDGAPIDGGARTGTVDHTDAAVDEHTWTYEDITFTGTNPAQLEIDLSEDHATGARALSDDGSAPFVGFNVEDFPQIQFVPRDVNRLSDGTATFTLRDHTTNTEECPSELPDVAGDVDGNFCLEGASTPSELTLVDASTGNDLSGVSFSSAGDDTWQVEWQVSEPTSLEAQAKVVAASKTGLSFAQSLVNDPGAPTINDVRVANWDAASGDHGEWVFSDAEDGPFAATGRMLVEVDYESFSLEQLSFTLEEDGNPGNNAEWVTDVATSGEGFGEELVPTGTEPIVHLAKNVAINDGGTSTDTGAGCVGDPTPLFWGERTCYFWIETKSIDRAVQTNLPTLEDDTLYDVRVELTDATGGDAFELVVDQDDNEGVRAEGFNMVLDPLVLSPADESRQDNPFSNEDFLEVGFATNLTVESTGTTNSTTEDGDDDEAIWNAARAWTCFIIPRDLPNEPAPSQDDVPLVRYLSASNGAPTCYPVHKPTEDGLNPRSHVMDGGNGPLLLGTGPDGDQSPEGAMFRLDFSISQLLAEGDFPAGSELREALTGIGSGQEDLLDEVLVRVVVMDEHGNVDVLHLPSGGHASSQGLDLGSFDPKIKARNTASYGADLGAGSKAERDDCLSQDDASACDGLDGFFRGQTLAACVQPRQVADGKAGRAFPASVFRTDEGASGNNTRANPCYRGLQLIPDLDAQDPYGEIIIPISLDNFGTQADDITVRWGYISGPTDWDVLLQRGTQSADDRLTVSNVAARDSADDPGTSPMELRIRPAADAIGGERLRLNVTLWSDASARLPQDQQRENLILEAILLPVERADLTIGPDKTKEVLQTTEPEETFEVPLHIKNEGNTEGTFEIDLTRDQAYTSSLCDLGTNADGKINIRTLVDGDERTSVFLEAGANRTITLSVNVGRNVEASDGFPYDCTFVVEKNNEVITTLPQAPTLSIDVVGTSDVRIFELVTDDGIDSESEITGKTITRIVPPSQLMNNGFELPLYLENAGSVAVEPLVQLRERSVTGNLNAKWTATAADDTTLQEADFEDIFSLSVSDGDDPTQISDMADADAFDDAPEPDGDADGDGDGFLTEVSGDWVCVSKDGPTSDGDSDTDPRSICKLPFKLNLASAGSNPAVIGDELVYEFSFGESGVANPPKVTVKVVVGHVGEVTVEENSRPVVGLTSPGGETATSRIRLNASLIENRDFNVLGQGVVEASRIDAEVVGMEATVCDTSQATPPSSIQTDSERRTFFEFRVKATFDGTAPGPDCAVTGGGGTGTPTYTVALDGFTTDPTVAFSLGVQDENNSELRVVHPAHVRFIDATGVPDPDPAASLLFQPEAVQDATGDQYARLGFDVPGIDLENDPLPDVTLTRDRTPTIAFPDSDLVDQTTPTNADLERDGVLDADSDGKIDGVDSDGDGTVDTFPWRWTRTPAASALHSTQFHPFFDRTTTQQPDGTPQADGAATVWSTQNRKVFLLGGEEDGALTTNVYEFDPRSREAEALSATLPTAARDIAAVYTGQRTLLFGGADASGNGIDQALEWSTGSTTFTNVADENDGACTLDRIGAHAVWTGQQAFLFGGTETDTGPIVSSVCSYDPSATQTDSFQGAGTLPPGWDTVAGAAWDGEFIYVVGGDGAADTVAVYDVNLDRFRQDPFDLPGSGALIDGGLIWMGDQFLFLLEGGTAQVWHDEDLPAPGSTLDTTMLSPVDLPAGVEGIRPVWTGYLGYFLNATAGDGSVVQFSLGGHILDTRTQFGRSSSAVPAGNVTLYTWSDKTDAPGWREGWNPVVLHITDLDGFPAEEPGNDSAVTPSVDLRFVRAADNGKITDTYDLLENFQPKALGGGYYLLNLSIPDGFDKDTFRGMADRPGDQSNDAGLQWAMRVQLGTGESIAGDQLRGSAYFTLQDLGLADGEGDSLIEPASAFNGGSRLTQGSTVEQHTIAHWGARFIGGPVDPAVGPNDNRFKTGPGLHDLTVFLFEEQVATPRSQSLGGLQHQQVRDHDFQPLTGAEPSVAYRPFTRGFGVAGDIAPLAEKGSEDPYAYYTAKLNLADLGTDLQWLVQLTLDDDQNNRIGKPQASVDVVEDREAATHGLPMPLAIQPPAGAVLDEDGIPVRDRAADFDVNPTADRITLDMRALPGFLPDRGAFTLTPFVRENNQAGTAVGVTHGTVPEDEAIDFRIRGQGLLTISPGELPDETEADIQMELRASISPASLVDIAQVEIEGEDPIKLKRGTGSQYSGTFTPTAIGEIELVFTALDIFGGASSVTRTLDVVENAAPRIGVSSGVEVDGTYFLQTGGQITFNVTDSGIVGGEILVFKETGAAEDPDPEPSENADGTLNVTGLGPSLAEGTYPTTVTLVNTSDDDEPPIEGAQVWLNITAPGETEPTDVLSDTTDDAGEISGSVVLDGTGTHSVTVQARNVTDDGEVEEFEHTFDVEVIDTSAGRTELDVGTPECEDTQCTVTVPSGLQGDGTTATFIVNATDTSGLSRERSFDFEADEGVPTVSLSAGNPSVAGSPTIVGPSTPINVQASDDGAGVDENVNLVALRGGEEVGSSTVAPGEGVQVRQFGLQGDGTFQIRAEAEDLLGNSATTTQNFQLDATGPEIDIGDQPFTRVSSGLRVSLDASDDSGVDRVTIQYRVGDTGSFQTASLATNDQGAYVTTLSGLPESGDLVYSVTATDRLDNEATTSRTTFSLGDAPSGEDNLPTVTITSPTDGATVEDTIEVTYTVGHPDNVPVSVSSVTMVGAGGTEVEATPGETSAEIDTTQLDEGQATIAVTVTDDVGVQATATIEVTVDNQPAVPNCPGQDVRRAGSGVPVCFQLSTESDVQEVQVTLVKNGDEVGTQTLEPNPEGTYRTDFDLEEGSYVLKITKVKEDGTTQEKISEPFVVQSGDLSEEPVVRLIVAIVLGVLVMAGAAYASFGRWN